jgi:hypothetical protein
VAWQDATDYPPLRPTIILQSNRDIGIPLDGFGKQKNGQRTTAPSQHDGRLVVPLVTPDRPAASYAADPRAQAIAQAAQALVTARDRWLNPPELVDRVPEVVAGFPDRLVPKNETAKATLRKRTLTALYNQRGTPEGAWLDGLHRTLDEAVAAAYGWPADLSEDEVLTRLLTLNLARSAIAN